MLNGIKIFARKHLLNSSSPLARIIYYKLKTLYEKIVHIRRRNMTYHEIEACISRQYEELFGRPIDWTIRKPTTKKYTSRSCTCQVH